VGEKLQSRFFKAQDGLNLHALVYGEESAVAPIVCLPGLTARRAISSSWPVT